MQELGCQWVDEQDFSYKTTFSWQPDVERPQSVLRFEGLDTVCRVFLNGELVAEHDNMFVPLEVPVSGARARRRERAPGGLRFCGAAPASSGAPSTPRRRACSRPTSGWKIAPSCARCSVCSGGIGARGSSRAGSGARSSSFSTRRGSSDVYVRQAHRADGKVELTFETVVEGNARVVHVIDGVGVLRGDGAILIEQPKLWQPVGFGSQHLYSVQSFALPAGFDLASVPSEPSEALSVLSLAALDRSRPAWGSGPCVWSARRIASASLSSSRSTVSASTLSAPTGSRIIRSRRPSPSPSTARVSSRRSSRA